MPFFTYYILSSAKHPDGQFPYGLMSPVDAYARGLQKIMSPPPLASEFVGMVSYGPTCFLDLIDDDGESDGSSVTPQVFVTS